MYRYFLVSGIALAGFFFLCCGSGSRAYKIEQAKIHLDKGNWDKAIEELAKLDNDDEVYRLRAGAYGGKAGLSVIDMGLKFINKDEDEGGGGSDLFSFLEGIGVTSLINCGDDSCIGKAIDEIGKVQLKLDSDYFTRAFFKFFRASVNFLGIKDEMTEFTEADILAATGAAQKPKISCFLNSFQIEVAGLKYDLNQTSAGGGTFFDSVDDMLIKVTHCKGYVCGGVNDLLCSAAREDSGSCKWACSLLCVTEAGNYNLPGDMRFDEALAIPPGSTHCTAGGIAIAGNIDWSEGGGSQPSYFKDLTGSEALGGLMQNTGGGGE